MREDQHWPERDVDLPSDPETTAVGPPPPAEFLLDEPLDATEDALVGELLEAGEGPVAPPSPGKRLLARAFMIAGCVLGVGVLLYGVDLIISAGDVPRGVTVAGVEVGGLSRDEAEAKLRRELEPRLTQPVPIEAGDVRTVLDPAQSGLGLDWPSTIAQAGRQPLDPVERVRSFFRTREVGVVTVTDPDELHRSIARLADTRINHPPTEGSIGFVTVPGGDGAVNPYPIEPRDGQTLVDVKGAGDILRATWLDKSGVRLPVALTPVKVTSAGVHSALDRLVAPAVAKPVTLHGDGADAVLKPSAIAAALKFSPADGGALKVEADPAKLQQAVRDPLVTTEKSGKDAQIVFTGDAPVVQPSEDARKIDWNRTFQPLMDVLAKPDGRDLTVRYQTARPRTTTEAANALGIKEVVGEFTTSGLSGPAATNARVMAAEVNGVVLRPGETFSLNARVGARGRSEGYVPAPVNEDGYGPVVLGGGASQFTTTLYNAAYFAGLTDAGHTEHSYHLDRYPVARDAVAVSDSGAAVDLKFTNSLSSGVAIQTSVSGDSVTVKIWGTKQFRVASSTGELSGFQPPPLEPGSGPDCRPSSGQPGFTTSDTRVVYDLATGAEVRRDTRTVQYAPKPAVICGFGVSSEQPGDEPVR
ncbi:VanW family protein [Amycolatopsis thermophila]|uniref:Vancomycin resistance protein YoaR n=1 Tax=Amycolatopsis thermophila TaxID=206084 RepID=A0ABU0EU68_9PSEU|nr:VanW family protein [Amycolatopsis thermophila]MDQ0378337.1 vancomycin resistance protein YoaR [Amycolatopsis thermophila]